MSSLEEFRSDILGTWRLVEYKAVRIDNGETIYPMGLHAEGFITYSPDGFVSVQLSEPGAPKFSAGDLKGGTMEEASEVMRRYLAYCGRFELQDMSTWAKVIHHMDVCTFPNWIGGSQERLAKIDGNRLEIQTSPSRPVLLDIFDSNIRLSFVSMMSSTHSVITPSIMYWGTPVVLVTTENKNGTTNIAPISSAWWLGHRCMLGIAAESQTTINLLRTKQCVLNLPSDDMGHYINAIAKKTGTPEVPPIKQALDYEYCQDKFEWAGLTRQVSGLIRPPRVAECPVQMEAELMGFTELMKDLPDRAGFILGLEVKVLRTHVRHDIRLAGHANRIDPDRWRPMIMSFQELYGLAPNKVIKSKLASIDEESYRPLTRSKVVNQGGDMDRAETNETVF